MPNIIEIQGYEKVCCNCAGFHILATEDGAVHYMGHCAWGCQKYKSVTDSCLEFKERGNMGAQTLSLWQDNRKWEAAKELLGRKEAVTCTSKKPARAAQ